MAGKNPPLPPFSKQKVTLWSGGMGGFKTSFSEYRIVKPILSDVKKDLYALLKNCPYFHKSAKKTLT
jgi:hypothetical protein